MSHIRGHATAKYACCSCSTGGRIAKDFANVGIPVTIVERDQ
jgi:hypothetical protein